MTQDEWMKTLRRHLAGQYTERTIGKHLYEEVRFVADAYLEKNLSNLELLHRTSDLRLYLRRYGNVTPLVLSAMIYDFCTARETQLFQVSEMVTTPGSPAAVFGLDTSFFRQQIEGLHDQGWLRYETTHNLDQIPLRPNLSSISFLTAYFEDREPSEDTKLSQGDLF